MEKCNILLVDDEKEFLEPLAQRLAERGFGVHCAFSGQQALDLMKGRPEVDVVFLDLKMPGMDGAQTLEKLKKSHPLVEVVMLTGAGAIPAAVQTIQLGAFDYLTKPCDLDLLVSKATKAVARKKDRETKIFDVQTKPYITKKERDELIARIMEE